MPNQVETDIDFIKEKVRKLNGLLSDPQPGFITWCAFFYGTIEEICKRFKEETKTDA